MQKLGQKELFLLLLAFFVFGMLAEWFPLLVGAGAGMTAMLVANKYGER